MFIENGWYAAALTSEIDDDLLMRRILDQRVVLFRDEDGRIAALSDRCPHRFAPLSKGRRIGSAIQCPYHGLEFDRSGRCVGGLGGHAPDHARVRSYPVEERGGIVWIWPGDETLADPDLIADLGAVFGGSSASLRYLPLACDYRLATDNLMDLSHAAILHEETLGRLTPGLADGKLSAKRIGNSVLASTRIANTRRRPGVRDPGAGEDRISDPLGAQFAVGEPGRETPPRWTSIWRSCGPRPGR